jgi:phage terminase large subunit-like protein
MSSPQQLQLQAEAEIEKRRRYRSTLGVIDFIPAVRPTYSAPVHLAPYGSILERTETSSVSAGLSLPPRHSKTETTLAGAVRRLLRRPETRIAYVSYGIDIAWEKSQAAYELAKKAGVKLTKRSARMPKASQWETEAGGSFYATGLAGTLTGKGFDLLIVDDPHKNRAEVESPVYRRRVFEWFSGTARNRLEPGGSTIVCHTRWHPDDLIGRILSQDKLLPEAEREWEYVAMPAIKADGSALWPERWPLSELLKHRRDSEYDWWSLYMCSPRPRGESVFQDAHFTTELPRSGVRYAIGVDLAYTAKTHSDYSVAVVLAECGGKFTVIDVLRMQVEAPKFADRLALLAKSYAGAPVVSYAYGTEIGACDFIKKTVKSLRVLQGNGDKFVRAQPVAAAWNRGQVLLPKRKDRDEASLVVPDAEDRDWRPESDPYPWVGNFVAELVDFTGLHDAHDDQVDALAAAYDRLAPRSSGNAGGGVVVSGVPLEDRTLG